jgi:hypothetical protein
MWVCMDMVRTRASICVCSQTTRIDWCTWIQSPCVHLNLYVYGHPSMFRFMHFGAPSRRTCGRAFAAGARAGAPALGCICLRVQSPLRMHRCVYHALMCMRVCVRLCEVTSIDLARSSARPSIVARRARPQAHLLHEGEGAPRVARPVQALGGTVRPAPAAQPPCAFAAVPALRCYACAAACALPRRALDRATRRWMLRQRRCRPRRARMTGVRGRPARGRGGPEPPGAAVRLGRRYADNTELAALPAAVDWPSLKEL